MCIKVTKIIATSSTKLCIRSPKDACHTASFEEYISYQNAKYWIMLDVYTCYRNK